MKFKYDKDTEKLIVREASTLEYNQMKIWLSRYVKGYKFMPAFKRGVWSGKIDHFHDGQVNMGLWKECFKGLLEVGCKFELENKKDFPLNRDVTLEKVTKFCEKFFKDHKIKKKDGEVVDFMPYDYQIETAYKILNNRYCLGEVATSGGKSLILSIVFFYTLTHVEPDAKFLLIVPSISLVTQFYDNLVEYNLGFQENDEDPQNQNPVELRIQEIMSDKPRKYSGVGDPNVYIACYQSLAKKDNWDDEFFEQLHTVAVDEAHQCKATSLITILERTFGHAYNRFGVSGTFPDDMSAEILTIGSVLGPVVNSIKARKLQAEGKISHVKIKQIHLNHDDPDFNQTLIDVRKLPNQGARAYQLEGEYIRHSDKRMDFVSKLVQKCKSNTLVLFNIIEYGTRLKEKLIEDLDESIEILYIDGSVKKKQREEIKSKMELTDGVTRVLVATYGTLSTGVSINNLHNIVLAESFKSEQRIIQSIGRALRLHETKDKAIIFDLIDCFTEANQRNAFYRHGKERATMYRKHGYPFDTMKFVL
ncbi:MAG: DNA helicase UvsW [uncultured marine phage]|uniref:DNA helicase UvsW n=1 Tax=uncultured marine phage TaxID=707152 RepID=A0A8D9FSA2_9VIRU|nr:MAG: DNA helicase UvsW [uncultured marine phage]